MTDAATGLDGRLNFIVLMTDDQGHWAMPNRMPELVMPHLEELLEESLELEQFYCASPVCSPARASLLTGRMPSAHGVHDWLVGDRHPDVKPDRYLEGQPTTPEVLAQAGYECSMSGKWHMGDARHPAPGFTHWYAHRYGGGPYFEAPIWRDGEEDTQPGYFTHAITDNALAFLKSRDRQRPFYMQVNYTAPHDPWLNSHPQEYLSLYDESEFPSVPREPRHPWSEARGDSAATFENPKPHLAGYCASLAAVDEGLGRIRQAVQDQGIADRTVIIYMSDNGFSCGHHGIWGKGNGTWPLNFWDNSVRVPFVIHLPGGASGATSALASATALHPTICDLAGVEPPQDRWAAAGSIAPLLRGGHHTAPEMVAVFGEYGGGRMITDGRFKYVTRHQGEEELYDLEEDPGETDNRAEVPELQDRKRELAASLGAWFQARERGEAEGFTRGVTGFGQVHPVSRGLPDSRSYVSADQPVTGTG